MACELKSTVGAYGLLARRGFYRSINLLYMGPWLTDPRFTRRVFYRAIPVMTWDFRSQIPGLHVPFSHI